MQKPSDELLIAYLDGELDERRCSEIESWLEQDASASERVAQLTESAAVDMKNGAAAGTQPVYAEGPFGTLDAHGFALVDKGSVVQFTGPARLVMNGKQP